MEEGGRERETVPVHGARSSIFIATFPSLLIFEPAACAAPERRWFVFDTKKRIKVFMQHKEKGKD